MSDLKNQIFALLKKRPDSAGASNSVVSIGYDLNKSIWYCISLFKDVKDKPYSVNVRINGDFNTYIRDIELTEKEYMDMKWTIEEWARDLEEKAFEDFAKFAERDPNSMDDLLDD